MLVLDVLGSLPSSPLVPLTCFRRLFLALRCHLSADAVAGSCTGTLFLSCSAPTQGETNTVISDQICKTRNNSMLQSSIWPEAPLLEWTSKLLQAQLDELNERIEVVDRNEKPKLLIASKKPFFSMTYIMVVIMHVSSR